MTTLEKVLAGYALLSGLSCVALVVLLHRCGDDPMHLLDGSRLACVLDDRDRALMLDAAVAHTAAYEYAERESLELDYIYSLPAREHPAA